MGLLFVQQWCKLECVNNDLTIKWSTPIAHDSSLYLGTNIGVFLSTNGGKIWTDISKGTEVDSSAIIRWLYVMDIYLQERMAMAFGVILFHRITRLSKRFIAIALQVRVKTELSKPFQPSNNHLLPNTE